jgi:hypothetical protein
VNETIHHGDTENTEKNRAGEGAAREVSVDWPGQTVITLDREDEVNSSTRRHGVTEKTKEGL